MGGIAYESTRIVLAMMNSWFVAMTVTEHDAAGDTTVDPSMEDQDGADGFVALHGSPRCILLSCFHSCAHFFSCALGGFILWCAFVAQ